MRHADALSDPVQGPVHRGWRDLAHLRGPGEPFKIEGRQRSRSYTEAVVKAFRAALDAHGRGAAIPAGALAALSEGSSTTRGAYQKTWR